MDHGPAQSLREHFPHPALRPLVVCVWEQRVAAEAVAHRFRTVPDGSTEIVCAIGRSPLVCGPRTGPGESVVAPGTTIVGLRLRPGVAAGLLGLDATELVDAEIDAAELLGRDSAARLAACASGAAAAHELERQLMRQPPPGDATGARATRLLGAGHSVAQTAHELSMSERQLRRRCRATVGVGPKTLARTLRYQRFLALAARVRWPQQSLARLAADAGYADQAHLTREACRLAGRSPARVLREAALECAHSHDHAASHAVWLAP